MKMSATLLHLSSVRTRATLFLMGCISVLYFIPRKVMLGSRHLQLCLSQRYLGIDCPGCGMTRALYSFMHGNFRVALHFNLAILSIIPVLLTEILMITRHQNKILLCTRKVSYASLPILLVINYIVKHS